MQISSRNEQFIELLSRHQNELFGYIQVLVQDVDDARDVFQQTSIVLWRKFAAFDGVNFRGWACRTARFEAMNFLRAKHRGRQLFGEALLDELTDLIEIRPEPQQSRLDALQVCLGKLSPTDRTLVEQCYSKGATIRAVAEHLGRSAQSVCNSLSRIRHALLMCVNRALGVEDSL